MHVEDKAELPPEEKRDNATRVTFMAARNNPKIISGHLAKRSVLHLSLEVSGRASRRTRSQMVRLASFLASVRSRVEADT